MPSGRTIVQAATLLALLAGGGGYIFVNRDMARKELAPVVSLPDDIALADPTKVISRVVGIPLGGEEKKADQPPPAQATAPTPAPQSQPQAQPQPAPQPQPQQPPPQPQAQPQPAPAPAPAQVAVAAPPPPAPSKAEIAERDFAAAMEKYKAGDKSVIPELEKAAGETSKPAQNVHTVAWLLAQNRQVDEALGQFRRAASLDPQDTVIKQNLATVLAQTGRNAEAYTAIGELLKLQPEHGLGQRLKSVLEQRCGGPCK